MGIAKSAIKRKVLQHRFILMGIFALGVLLFAVLTLVNHRITGSDDTIFQTQILPYQNVLDWIQYRYSSWSGRVFSEGLIYLLSPAPFYIWQMLTTAAYALFSALLFLHYRLFSNKRTPAKNYLMAIVALCIPFLMHKAVLADGAIWMTGSIVYFWTSALGLLALYPIAHYLIHKKRPHWAITVLGLIAAIVATVSQEQVGALLLGLTFAFLIYTSVQKVRHTTRPFPFYLLVFSVIIAISFTLSFLAPGNGLRLDLELVRWLPDFYSVPVTERILSSYRWFLDAVINHTGLLLVLSWLAMAGLFISKVKRTLTDYTLAGLLAVMGVFGLIKGSESTLYWFEFYASWKMIPENPLVALNIIPWGIGLIVTLIAPVILFQKRPTGLLIALLFAAAFAATAIMVLSPTMYASSWRSIFVPSVVLGFIVLLLFDRIFDNYVKQRYLFVLVITSLALSHYIYQVARLIQD